MQEVYCMLIDCTQCAKSCLIYYNDKNKMADSESCICVAPNTYLDALPRGKSFLTLMLLMANLANT